VQEDANEIAEIYYNPRKEGVQYNSNGDMLYIGSGDTFCNYGVSEVTWSCIDDITEFELGVGDEFTTEEITISFLDIDGTLEVTIVYENGDVFYFSIDWEIDMYYVFAENQTTWYSN
jgi:hypothetical protein